MADPRFITTPEELEAWHRQETIRLQQAQAERMAAWEYLRSKEFQQETMQNILDETHANIQPPWEE